MFIGARNYGFDDLSAIGRTIQQVIPDIVDVDLHPAGPRRGRVAGQLPDANVDKSPHGTFATHRIAKELGTWTYADLKIERERLALARIFRIERGLILCLETMQHADDRLLDDDPQIDDALICLCHACEYPTRRGITTQKPKFKMRHYRSR